MTTRDPIKCYLRGPGAVGLSAGVVTTIALTADVLGGRTAVVPLCTNDVSRSADPRKPDT